MRLSNTETSLLRIGQEQSTSIWSPLTSPRRQARHMRDLARQRPQNSMRIAAHSRAHG
jgi:hypothetical protein